MPRDVRRAVRDEAARVVRHGPDDPTAGVRDSSRRVLVLGDVGRRDGVASVVEVHVHLVPHGARCVVNGAVAGRHLVALVVERSVVLLLDGGGALGDLGELRRRGGRLVLQFLAVPRVDVVLGVGKLDLVDHDVTGLVYKLRAVPDVHVALRVHELRVVDENVALLVNDWRAVVVLDAPDEVVDGAAAARGERGHLGRADLVQLLSGHTGLGELDGEVGHVDANAGKRVTDVRAHLRHGLGDVAGEFLGLL